MDVFLSSHGLASSMSKSPEMRLMLIVSCSPFFACWLILVSRRRHTRCSCDWSSDVCSSDQIGFSSRRRHTRCSRDWSSDVCSSDLAEGRQRATLPRRPPVRSEGSTHSTQHTAQHGTAHSTQHTARCGLRASHSPHPRR